MQCTKNDEMALIWDLTPPWRKFLRNGKRFIMVPNADGWGTQPVHLHDLNTDDYLARLSGEACSPDERHRNRQLFAVWEECANVLRDGLKRHRKTRQQHIERSSCP